MEQRSEFSDFILNTGVVVEKNNTKLSRAQPTIPVVGTVGSIRKHFSHPRIRGRGGAGRGGSFPWHPLAPCTEEWTQCGHCRPRFWSLGLSPPSPCATYGDEMARRLAVGRDSLDFQPSQQGPVLSTPFPNFISIAHLPRQLPNPTARSL